MSFAMFLVPQTQQTDIMWEPQLETAFLKPHLWRKSSQWSMIQRRHAEVWPTIFKQT